MKFRGMSYWNKALGRIQSPRASFPNPTSNIQTIVSLRPRTPKLRALMNIAKSGAKAQQNHRFSGGEMIQLIKQYMHVPPEAKLELR